MREREEVLMTTAVRSDNIEPLRGSVEVIIPSINPTSKCIIQLCREYEADCVIFTSFHIVQAITPGLSVIG